MRATAPTPASEFKGPGGVEEKGQARKQELHPVRSFVKPGAVVPRTAPPTPSHSRSTALSRRQAAGPTGAENPPKRRIRSGYTPSRVIQPGHPHQEGDAHMRRRPRFASSSSGLPGQERVLRGGSEAANSTGAGMRTQTCKNTGRSPGCTSTPVSAPRVSAAPQGQCPCRACVLHNMHAGRIL